MVLATFVAVPAMAVRVAQPEARITLAVALVQAEDASIIQPEPTPAVGDGGPAVPVPGINGSSEARAATVAEIILFVLGSLAVIVWLVVRRVRDGRVWLDEAIRAEWPNIHGTAIVKPKGSTEALGQTCPTQ